MEALPRETIVDVLEKRLREDILAGRHPAGSYLPPERELADGFGVTRTSSSTPSADWRTPGCWRRATEWVPGYGISCGWAERTSCRCSCATAPTGSVRSSKSGAVSVS